MTSRARWSRLVGRFGCMRPCGDGPWHLVPRRWSAIGRHSVGNRSAIPIVAQAIFDGSNRDVVRLWLFSTDNGGLLWARVPSLASCTTSIDGWSDALPSNLAYIRDSDHLTRSHHP